MTRKTNKKNDLINENVDQIIDEVGENIIENVTEIVEKSKVKLKGFVKVIVGKLGHGKHKSGAVLEMHSTTAEALVTHGVVKLK